MTATDLFTIVTPTLNSEAFLDETIISVVSQAGSFRLRYHVQDGGSRDGTRQILESWQDRLAASQFPIRCRGIEFSFTTSNDGGMYQAINRAFATARADAPDAPSVMGWINSDDRLAPGALATVMAVLTDLPEVSFLGSRIALINEAGVTLGIEPAIAYDRARLAGGHHDGRRGSFVMQEGTFWTSELWDKVGGLDERFRLAGDWDLWRRFAEHAPLTTIDTVLGFHRRRPGQLSESMDRYYAEIDALPPELPEARAARSKAAKSAGQAVSRSIVHYQPHEMRWRYLPGGPLERPSIHAGGVVFPELAAHVLSGATAPGIAHAELNLAAGSLWMNEPLLMLEADVPISGVWTLVVRCRNWRQNQRVMVRSDAGGGFDERLEVSGHRFDIVLRVPLKLRKGRSLIEIVSDQNPADEDKHFLLIVDLHVEVAEEEDGNFSSVTEASPAEEQALREKIETLRKRFEASRRTDALARPTMVRQTTDARLLKLKDFAITR